MFALSIRIPNAQRAAERAEQIEAERAAQRAAAANTNYSNATEVNYSNFELKKLLTNGNPNNQQQKEAMRAFDPNVIRNKKLTKAKREAQRQKKLKEISASRGSKRAQEMALHALTIKYSNTQKPPKIVLRTTRKLKNRRHK